MATTVVVDPVTRIEGHLRIEMDVKDVETSTGVWQVVGTARSSGTLFRGFEIFLKGRDPRDAWFITQRICGVCPAAHAETSIQAIERAFGVQPTPAAILMRNILHGAFFIYDHITHTYVLVGPELGIICKHPPMVPPALGKAGVAKLSLGSSYVKAIEIQRKATEIVALWGGKFPHHASEYPGGMTVRPTADRIANTLARMVEIWEFVAKTMVGDLLTLVNASERVGEKLSEILGINIRGLEDIGVSTGNFLCYGIFPAHDDYDDWYDPSKRRKALFHSGAWDGNFKRFDESKITEYVKYSWYTSPSGLHPSVGETEPNKGKGGAYSWIKAPRYENKVYEVGPLARMVNTFGLKWRIPRVHPITGEDYGDFVYEMRNPKGSLLDRIAARVACTLIIANKMFEWIAELKNYMNEPVVNYKDVPKEGEGFGLWEAPRGALGHWLKIKNYVIEHYQCVVPSTWNLSPRDDMGQPGPVETALQCGTTWLPKDMSVADVCNALYPEEDIDLSPLGINQTVKWGDALATALTPLGLAELNLEPANGAKYNTSIALAIVRSFDPCIACAVHVVEKR
ncbi:MAG: cytochrome-c3 hydrogenase [Archaeoglobales archaeon]|nr:MAG: cytochrome-c3 hydrogenase [Archaeoglobales archaeon]